MLLVIPIVAVSVNDCHTNGGCCIGISKKSGISNSGNSSGSIVAVKVVAVAVVDTKENKTNFTNLYLSISLVIIRFIHLKVILKKNFSCLVSSIIKCTFFTFI